MTEQNPGDHVAAAGLVVRRAREGLSREGWQEAERKGPWRTPGDKGSQEKKN